MAFPKNFDPTRSDNSSGGYAFNQLKSSGDKIKVRVLGDWVTGRLVWGDSESGGRKPNRFKYGEKIPAEAYGINHFTGEKEKLHQFIAAVCYNYGTERVEILEIAKKTVIRQIYDLECDDDWGDSRGYDLTISRTGTGTDTKYATIPSNKGKFKKKVDHEKVDIEAIFTGENPFEALEREGDQSEEEEESKGEDLVTEDSDEVAESMPF